MIWKTILLIIILNVIFALAAPSKKDKSNREPTKEPAKEPSKRRSTHSSDAASSVAPSKVSASSAARSRASVSTAPSSLSAASTAPSEFSTTSDSTIKPVKRGKLSAKNLQLHEEQSRVSSNAPSTNGGAPLTARDPNEVYPDESASNVHVNNNPESKKSSRIGGSRTSGRESKTGDREREGRKSRSRTHSDSERNPKKPKDTDKPKKKHRRPSNSKVGSSVVSGSTATTRYPASEYSAAGYAPSAAGTESTLYPRSEVTGSDVTIHADQPFEENGYYSGSDADSTSAGSDTIYEEDEEYYEPVPAPLPDYYTGEDGNTYTRGGFKVAMSAVNPKLVTEEDLTYGTKNSYQLPAAGAAQYLNNKWK